MRKKNIAVFASGTGSNFTAIVENEKNLNYHVQLLVCNNSTANVLETAKQHNIQTIVLTKESFINSNPLVNQLKDSNIHLIVLAGFLWKIPDYLIKAFPNKIVNIHPSLLPKYGGKGMYGMNVHKAVIENKEKESGITIHLVNEEYDKGKIVFQEKVDILPEETAETLANKVLKLEHHSYAMYIDLLCT